MEALSLLRQCTMARKTAREEKDYYVFGHRRVPKDTPTAWKSQVQSEVSHGRASTTKRAGEKYGGSRASAGLHLSFEIESQQRYEREQ